MSNDLREAFNFNDRSGSGRLSYKELENVLRCLGKIFTLAELSELTVQIGKTEQDTFTFEDFSIVCDQIKRDISNSKDTVKTAFKVFDKDNDGFISSSELRQVLTTLGEKLTPEEANELIREADLDGNGRIDYNEFVTRMADLVA
ncbi:hypothetical protein HZS_6169 [Henneguya salminicola]|uniref:Calmodulin (Trinotate prediction) n=1 Tax=Henneguya salminicola TaxID=69463 RepID=A0A6G3ML26_HENSL|nr:hypothetical protein HZS_6169 [Henneguya salminicola]